MKIAVASTSPDGCCAWSLDLDADADSDSDADPDSDQGGCQIIRIVSVGDIENDILSIVGVFRKAVQERRKDESSCGVVVVVHNRQVQMMMSSYISLLAIIFEYVFRQKYLIL